MRPKHEPHQAPRGRPRAVIPCFCTNINHKLEFSLGLLRLFLGSSLPFHWRLSTSSRSKKTAYQPPRIEHNAGRLSNSLQQEYRRSPPPQSEVSQPAYPESSAHTLEKKRKKHAISNYRDTENNQPVSQSVSQSVHPLGRHSFYPELLPNYRTLPHRVAPPHHTTPHSTAPYRTALALCMPKPLKRRRQPAATATPRPAPRRPP